MSTGYVHPNADTASLLDAMGGGGGAGYYSLISKGVTSPTAPSTATGVDVHTYGSNDGFTGIYEMETLTVDSVSQIEVFIYGSVIVSDNCILSVAVDTGGGAGSFTQLTGSDGVDMWRSAVFSSTWNQTQMNALKVHITMYNGDTLNAPAVYAMYAKITYTESGGGFKSAWVRCTNQVIGPRP